jgi:hypothetical protein
MSMEVNEGGLARAISKSKTKVTGHISSDRGSDEPANRKKRQNLEKDLQKKGIGYKKSVGEYKYDSGEKGREVSYQTTKSDKMSKRKFGKLMRRLGRKHDQESVITKDKDKKAKLHYTDKSKKKSETLGKTKAGKHPKDYGDTNVTPVRGKKLPKKTKDRKMHYGEDTIPRATGRTLYVCFTWRGKYMNLQMFFPNHKMPSRADVQDAIQKVYPGSKVSHYDSVLRDPTEPLLQMPEQAQIDQEVSASPDENKSKLIKPKKVAVPDDKEKVKARDDKQLQQKQKRVSTIKRIILLKKMQALRSGGGTDITT